MSNSVSDTNFLEEMSNFVFASKYARYNDEKKRRETWSEAVDRLSDMHLRKFSTLPTEDIEKIKWAFQMVKDKYVVPSMRSLQFGGIAIEAHNARMFNCCALHIDSLRGFSESFYLLLCGVGVTFGLNSQYISRLPNLVGPDDKNGTVLTYTVQDNIEGWANSVEALLNCYFQNNAFSGRKIIFDYSKIRKKGSKLKTGGGKAPGYKGLKNCHIKIKQILDYIIEQNGQTRLKTINAYDILMHCADAVLSGGIRRAATAVVFQPDDHEMMEAKTFFKVDKYKRFSLDEDTQLYYGKVLVKNKWYDVEIYEYDYNILKEQNKISWFYIEPQRSRSNNSVILLTDEVSKEEFSQVFTKTKEFGEPGFVFASASALTLYNPCFEVSFIPITSDGRCGAQFCNLSSINGAKIKSINDWEKSVEAATIIGTLQASYTEFPFLNSAAKELTEEESLLGVSITGFMDNPDILLNYNYQKEMAEYAVRVNKEWADKIGINQASRVTLVKPEGTSSLVLGSASGIHPHHAQKYFRRIQCNKIDPVYAHLKNFNSHATEESVWSANKTDDVVSFPVEVPDGVMVKSDLAAIEHLEIIKNTQLNWVDHGTTPANKKPIRHNTSCTVVVNNEGSEWNDVMEYLYENRFHFAAVSLLGSDGDKIYKQAPLEKIDETNSDAFDVLKQKWTRVDYTTLIENTDTTKQSQTVVCAGNQCELKHI